MKRPLIILKAFFLFGGINTFSEVSKVKESSYHEQAINDIMVSRTSGDGHTSEATTNIALRVYKPTEKYLKYKETEEKKGELDVVIPDSKNVDVSIEYLGINENKIKRNIQRKTEGGKENLYVNLSHLDSHHNKKGRLVVVTKYR